MANKRQQIVDGFVSLFTDNFDGTGSYTTDLFSNVIGKQVFWDEVNDYPTVCVYAGTETREYLPGGFKWGFLIIDIRIYVKDENSKDRIEEIFEDMESILDDNNTLTVSGNDLCTDIRILSLTDDQGLLSPLGVGEITLEVRYEVQ